MKSLTESHLEGRCKWQGQLAYISFQLRFWLYIIALFIDTHIMQFTPCLAPHYPNTLAHKLAALRCVCNSCFLTQHLRAYPTRYVLFRFYIITFLPSFQGNSFSVNKVPSYFTLLARTIVNTSMFTSSDVNYVPGVVYTNRGAHPREAAPVLGRKHFSPRVFTDSHWTC